MKSSAWECTVQLLMERSLISNVKMDGSTEFCVIPLFVGLSVKQWPSSIAEIDRSERKLKVKVRREKYNPLEGSLQRMTKSQSEK